MVRFAKRETMVHLRAYEVPGEPYVGGCNDRQSIRTGRSRLAGIDQPGAGLVRWPLGAIVTA
ncbi:hypothetical protein D3C75_1274970 [compost metagenome]